MTDENTQEKVDYTIDFVTSSAISRISLKFLVFYLPIIWISGYMVIGSFFGITSWIHLWLNNWLLEILFFPVWMFAMYFVFLFGIAIFAKAFLLIINMVHKPKEGIFKATEGEQDFEFWRLRVELKKLALWFMSNCPLPWVVMWGFRWFGVRIDFSSHLQDAWVDSEFIDFGRKVTVGQGAIVMSSMVIGNYLIIRKIIIDDYTVVGGVSNISPGTILGKESVLGAFTTTHLDQIIEPGWIYLGQPANKLKPNKYALERTGKIIQRDVDEEIKYEVDHKINIDEDKKDLVDGGGS